MAVDFEIIDNNELQFDLGDRTELEFGTRDIVEVRQSSDYEDLTNKPSINGVTLVGNKTTEDLHIQAGVTSWNGQTGDVTYTPPDYVLTYDELSSVGYAEIGEAVTGEPNYTPTGTVTGSVTTSQEAFMSGGSVGINFQYGSYKLYITGFTFTPTTTPKSVVTGIGDLAFTGNGVKFAVEMEQ